MFTAVKERVSQRFSVAHSRVLLDNNEALWHRGRRSIRLWTHRRHLLADQSVVGFVFSIGFTDNKKSIKSHPMYPKNLQTKQSFCDLDKSKSNQAFCDSAYRNVSSSSTG